MSPSGSKTAFFRQSGWMLMATTLMGVFMYAVHMAAKEMPKAEYGVFLTLLQILNLMGGPGLALQTVFAQQTAGAFSVEEKRQLCGTVRTVGLGLFLLWGLLAALVYIERREIISLLKINNPAALWVTLAVAQATLILPLVMGLLQGAQNFFWLGWVTIANGIGRFVAIGVIVLWLGGQSAGAMFGALLGMLLALSMGIGQTRTIWRSPRAPFDWKAWLGRVVPLTLGLGATAFLLSADMILVQSLFEEEETGYYGAAGMIGRALVFFTIPLTAVMFPKIVHSAARAEKTDVLAHALGATAMLGGLASLGCTLFPSLPLLVVYDESFLKIAPLVPWFAWCMLPLTLSNVLINNLLARARYDAVPWLVVVAFGYGAALTYFHQNFFAVVKTLGVFSTLLFLVALGFTWKQPPTHRRS